MRKLKIALTVLFALSLSLFLFACGGGEEEPITSVTVGNTLTADDTATQSDWAELVKQLDMSVVYGSGEPQKYDVTTENCTFEGAESIAWGTVGNYTVTVSPNEKNPNARYANVTVTIDHKWEATSTAGKDRCAKDGTTRTVQDTTAVVEYKGYHDTPAADVVKEDENVSRIAEFGTVVRNGAVTTVNTATVGRLERGMTISVRGQMQATSSAQKYYFPIIGIADRNAGNGGAGFVVRNDGWGIFGGIGGVGLLADSGKTDVTTPAGDLAAAEAAGAWTAYYEGTGSNTDDFATPQDVELSWRYRDNAVVELTFMNYTISRLYTVRVRVPDQQYFETVLHGEYVKMELKKVTVVQELNLESINSVATKSNANTHYLENQYVDLDTLEVKAKFEQSETPQTTTSFELWGTPSTGLTQDNMNDEGVVWTNLGTTPVTKELKTFKVTLTVAEDSSEKLLTSAEFNPTIVENAVNDANANDVVIDGKTYTAPTLYGAPASGSTAAVDPITFGAKDDKVLLTLTAGAEGAPVSLGSTELPSGVSGDYKHYVAFSVYTRGATVTRFNKTVDNVTVKLNDTAATVVGAAKVVNASRLDVVVFLDSTVIEKGVVISGAQTTDIVVDLTNVGTIAVSSKVTNADVTLHKNGTVTVEYDFGKTVDDTLLESYRLGIGSNLVKASTAKGEAEGHTWNNGNKVVVTTSGNKLTAAYTVVPNITSLRELSFVLQENVSGVWTVRAIDKVNYNLMLSDTAAKGTLLSDKVYAYATQARLYLAIPYNINDLYGSEVRGTLAIELNAGDATPDEYKAYEYLQKLDLSYVTDGDGNTTFTGLALKDFATVRTVPFGTFNNSKDTDHGAVVVITIDTTKVGIPATQKYAFKLSNTTETYYSVAVAVAQQTDRVIAKLDKTVDTQVRLSAEQESCNAAATYVTPVKDGEAAVLYTDAVLKLNTHSWGDEDSTTKISTCTVCGATKNTTEDIHDYKIAPVANAKTNGLTLVFDVYGANSDWNSIIANPYLDTAQKTTSNVLVTIPNIDTGNLVVGANTAGLAKGSTFPGASNLFNGGVWDSFLAKADNEGNTKDDAITMMLTVDPTYGIRFFKVTNKAAAEGKAQNYQTALLIHYDLTTSLGALTVKDFTAKFLELVEKNGLLFAQNSETKDANGKTVNYTIHATNLIVMSGSGSEVEALAMFNSAIGAAAPTAPASPAILYSHENPTPNEDTKLSAGYTSGTGEQINFNNPAIIFNPLHPGEKLTVTGKFYASTGADALVWHTIIAQITGRNSGNTTGNFTVFRGDGWSPSASMDGDTLFIRNNYVPKDKESAGDELLKVLKASSASKLIDFTVTFDYTDYSVFVCTIRYQGSYTPEESDAVNLDLTYTFKLDNPLKDYVGDGLYYVGLGGENVVVSNLAATRA